MTDELVQAIVNYARHPTEVRREVGMAMIRDGALTPVEERRLREALDERERIRRRDR